MPDWIIGTTSFRTHIRGSAITWKHHWRFQQSCRPFLLRPSWSGWHSVADRFQWVRIAPSNSGLKIISLTGGLMFIAVMIWPDLLFPLVWISLFLMVDPLVALLGGRSITAQVRNGRWDTVVVLFVATLICGFFWEMWNARALAKMGIRHSRTQSGCTCSRCQFWALVGICHLDWNFMRSFNLVDRLLGMRLASSFRFDSLDQDQ